MMRNLEERRVGYNATSLRRHSFAAVAVALLTTVGAANADDAAVCFDSAVKAEWTKAVRACTAAAKGGDATSQFNLGLLYSLGHGVVQDYAQAASWYRLAAEQGDTGAQNSLGLMYSKGQGVVQNYAQAVRWYTTAAEQGYVLAQNNLGHMYGNGIGVSQDYVRAHMWYNLAAVSGNENSVKGRDVAASRMTREQIAEAQRMATDCTAKNYKKC